MERDRLRALLLENLEAGAIPPEVVLAALRELALLDPGDVPPPSRWESLRALDGREGEALERVREALLTALLLDLRGHAAGEESAWPNDLPPCRQELSPDWATGSRVVKALRALTEAKANWAFVQDRPVEDALRRQVEEERRAALETLEGELPIHAFLPVRELIERLPEHPLRDRVKAFVEQQGMSLPDERRALVELERTVREAPDAEAASAAFDRLLAWPSFLAAPHLLSLLREPWRRDRAFLILHRRFGASWSLAHDVAGWLQQCARELEQREAAVRLTLPGHEVTALAVWFRAHREHDPELARAVEAWASERDPVATPSLSGRSTAPPVPRFAGVHEHEEEGARPEPKRSSAAVPERPAKPPREPFWRPHLRAFFAENWFLVAGILMVVAGASLVAYFTWDEHWLVRYTAIPGLLLGFTFLLARLGAFLDRRGELVANAAALLRGAAVLLLPIQAVVVSILARDPMVPSKTVVVPAMALLYLVVFVFALVRLTRAVSLGRNGFLVGALTFLLALLLARPVVAVFVTWDGATWRSALELVAYVAWMVVAVTLLLYMKRSMDAAAVREARGPRFVFGTLGFTLVQVLAWSFGAAGIWPRWHALAPWLILVGALALSVQRHALRVTDRERGHEGEAYVAYSGFGLGLLLGAADPWMRALTTVIVGVSFLHHGTWRERWNVHRWIGATALAAFVVALSFLPDVAEVARPWIAFGGAITFQLAGSLLARGIRGRRATETLHALVPALGLAAVGLGVVTQWQVRSTPWHTAVLIGLVALGASLRALRAQSARGFVTASALVALVLPYAGFVDLGGRTWHGNTMVFGLSCLAWVWIALTVRARGDAVRGARSSVLWIYGALAFFGMLLRATLEPVRPGDLESFPLFATMTGPVLMAGALVVAAYTSRSLVPGFLAMAILVVLFPELRLRYAEELDRLGWGSGLGSALSAIGLTGCAFWLRSAGVLRALSPGDRFLGRIAFPWRRHDASLFTTPITVSVLFLLARTCTRTYFANLPDLSWDAALAILLSSAGWFLQALYHARRNVAPLLTYVGLLFGMLGAHHLVQVLEPPILAREPFLIVAGSLVLIALARGVCRLPALRGRSSVTRVFARPLRRVGQSLAAFLAVLVSILLVGETSRSHHLTAIVLCALLLWHAVRSRSAAFGSLFFALAWLRVASPLTDWTGPPDFLWSLESIQASFVFIASALTLSLLLEFWKGLDAPSRGLRGPFANLGCLAYFVSLIGFLGRVPLDVDFPSLLPMAVVIAGFLLARAHGTSSLALLGLFHGHIYLLRSLHRLGSDSPFSEHPWMIRAAPLATFLIALSLLGSWLERHRPSVVVSRFLTFPSPHRWLAISAGLALLPPLLWRWNQEFFGAPFLEVHRWWSAPVSEVGYEYLGALVLALVAWRMRRVRLVFFAAFVLFVANVDLSGVWRLFDATEENLRDLHRLAFGALATAFPLLIADEWIRSPRVRRHLRRLGAVFLLLLGGAYLVHLHLPANVVAIAPTSLVFTGSVWLVMAGFLLVYERRPIEGLRPWEEVTRPLRHLLLYAATYAFLFALPWFRAPESTLLGLFLAPLLFFAWVEGRSFFSAHSGARAGVVLGSFLFWSAYLVPGIHASLLHGGSPLSPERVHENALSLLLLGLVWWRLGRTPRTVWMACVGAFSLFLGVGFLVTWSPFLLPSAHPVRAAFTWCVLAHLFLLASSPNAWLGRLARCLGVAQERLRSVLERSLDLSVVLVTHAVVLTTLPRSDVDSTWVAPLMAGAATCLLHAGWKRGSLLVLALGGLELVLALHMDLLVPSWLTTDAIAWVLLGAWWVWLGVEAFLDSSRANADTRRVAVAGAFFTACLAHVLHHRPWTLVGLTVFAVASGLLLLTPRRTLEPRPESDRLLAHGLGLLPIWFAYFFAVGREPEAMPALATAWPWTVAALVALVVAAFARRMAARESRSVEGFERPRTFHHFLATLEREGASLARTWTTFLLFAAIGLSLFAVSVDALSRTWLALVALQLGTAHEVWKGNVDRRPRVAALSVQALLFVACYSLRAFWIGARPGSWSETHDVWALLTLSVIVTGCESLWRARGPLFERALWPTTIGLPLFTFVFVLTRTLGVDLLLIALGLQAVLWSWLGKHESHSPYRVAAAFGFAAFVMVTFWAKLEWRVLHAYVIPVGLALLVLLHASRDHVPRATANVLRAVIHLTMVGTTAWSALLDPRYPIAFHVTLLLLSLLSMAGGAFLRVRLYLVLGFAALLVALASMVQRVLSSLDQGSRLTAIGFLILLLGVLLVLGTVYSKTHRDRVERWVARWRSWE